MKKFLLLVAVLAAAAGWVRSTPEYSYYRLRGALAAGDVPTVEEHLDLAVITGLAVDLLAATGVEAAKEAGGGPLGAALVGALAEAFAPAVKGVLAPLSADEVKRGIAAKEHATRIGAFELAGTADGLRNLQRLDQSALLDLNGKCGAKETRLRLVLEKRGGPLGGLVPNWKVVGVDKASLPEFAKACAVPAATAAAKAVQ